MKKFNLTELQELTEQELLEVEGGCGSSKARRKIGRCFVKNPCSPPKKNPCRPCPTPTPEPEPEPEC